MATNLDHAVTPVVSGAVSGGAVRHFLDKAARSLQTAVCGLQGHDPLLQVTGSRVFLRCTSCGHETPGWTTDGRRPKLRFGGDRERHRLN